MPANRRPPRIRGYLCLVLASAALLVSVSACGVGTATPVASFDPAGPCAGDGRRPGAYPELESLLPADLEGRRPDNLDSGRSCTTEALGTLAGHGIADLRFAGATWKMGGSSGMTVAVFQADRLDAGKMVEFYETGARAARRTDKYQVTDTTVAGKPARRLDVLGSDGTAETVVAWPAAAPGRVNVLLTADLGDTMVGQILDIIGSR
jgi:hypothetical protein